MTTPSRKPTAPPPYSPPARDAYGAGSPAVGDAASAPGPLHDYTAHQQSFLRNSTIEVLETGASTSLAPGADQAPPTSHDPFTALYEYFATRPPPSWTPDNDLLRHRLVIPPTADPNAFPFPQPEDMWLARDVTHLDWITFLNYLLPLQHGEKGDTNAESTKAADTWSQSASGSPVSRKPVSMPPVELRKGEYGQNGTSARAESTADEPEPERQQRIHDATDRWNQGFFRPRGLLVEVSVIPYASELMIEAGPVAGARETATPPVTSSDLPSPSSRRPHGLVVASYISAETDEITRSSSPPVASSSGRAADASSRELASDGVVRPLPSYRSRPHSPSSDRPRSAHWPPAELSSAQDHPRPPTAVPADSRATKHPLPDDLDEGDLKELRGAFAKFLLAPRSRDETAAALHEINRELQTRRQHTAKQLKVEIKAQRAEIKVKASQHQADRRAEKKRLKDAQRAYKAELKALKQSRKALEKQQKVAQREAKTFKKNARKAEKQKGDGAPPYKGWLEALELNRQESGIAQRAEPAPSTS